MDILIDTNIALYLLGGDEKVAQLLEGEIIYISFITQLELLAYPGISNKEQGSVQSFLDDCIIIDIDNKIKLTTVDIRKQTGLKLPDAIIAATAQCKSLPLLSADKDFKEVEELHLLSYQI